MRWSDASTITLLTGQPDLPPAWWRSLPMPLVLAAIGPESLAELLTEITLEHWPAASVGDVLPALHVLDPDEADEPQVAIALDRVGSWAGLLALTGRELVDQPFIQARPVLTTLFSSVLVRLVPSPAAAAPPPAESGASEAPDAEIVALAPATDESQPVLDADAEPLAEDASEPQLAVDADAPSATPQRPLGIDGSPEDLGNGSGEAALAEGSGDGLANVFRPRFRTLGDEPSPADLAAEPAEPHADGAPVSPEAAARLQAEPPIDEPAEPHEPAEDARDEAARAHRPAEDAGDEAAEAHRPAEDARDEAAEAHRPAEDARDEAARAHRPAEDAGDEAARAHRPAEDAGDEAAEALRQDERFADEAAEAAPGMVADADAEERRAELAEGSAPEPEAADGAESGGAGGGGEAGRDLAELIEVAFAGLDDKSWAVAQNRVFTDEPSAVDQLAKLFAVPPAEIAATETRLRARLDQWLASDEAAPYRAHLDELRRSIGPAAPKERLIGAASWHAKEIRALEVPAWQFVLATLPANPPANPPAALPARAQAEEEPGVRPDVPSAFGQPVPANGAPPPAPLFQAFAPATPVEGNGGPSEEPAKPYQPLKDVSQTRRCFRQPDGRWWLRIDVTAEQLAGGECALPTGFAAYLGLSPGESRTVRSAAGELNMTWHGRPVLESIERLLVDVGAKEGGHLFLTLSDEGVLRARHLPVAAQSAEKITKALRLVGYTAPGGTKDQAARVIATRIGMTGPVALPDLLTRLRERGDRDLLVLLD
ncbi:hypothetical protein [Nonomuraea sp. NPDC048916]|uniref:hypothetical protein n=1 Tax=Nonomuraea sp. NPDC048916 TaxID=3154232 RepID=UPI0034006C1D